MPLLDLDQTVTVEMEDGDAYHLKTELDYISRKLSGTGGISTAEAVRVMGETGMSVLDYFKSMPAEEYNARKDLTTIRIWLAGWSHPEPLTAENIKRIPPAHIKILLERIQALTEASAPFRPESEAKGND